MSEYRSGLIYTCMPSLPHLLTRPDSYLTRTPDGGLVVAGRFLTPGFMAALAAYCRHFRYTPDRVIFAEEPVAHYASALRFSGALGDPDDYDFDRVRAGKNYSPLVTISNPTSAEEGAGTINACISRLFAGCNAEYVRTLKGVVGELHENVASHANGSGFSCAQRWPIRGTNDFAFEFGIADSGMGFLRECVRVGIPGVSTHQQAIAWCIERGNTTKPPADEWAQFVPEDAPNVPMPEVTRRGGLENNHMGLGLALLVELVQHYGGSLYLASGDVLLYIDQTSRVRFLKAALPWQGVALAIQFRESVIRERTQDIDEAEFDTIIEQLRGIVDLAPEGNR